MTNGLLQIDATVNYALGKPSVARLTSDEIDSVADSPYNTYTQPGPAAGADRVARATRPSRRRRNPADGDWLFYVTVNLETGETKFTDDYDEFLQLQAGARRVLRHPVRPLLSGTTMRCAVLGDPIAHSLSPVLHRAGYAAAGLDDVTYDAVRVPDDGLADFVAGLDDELARAVADDAAQAAGARARRHGHRPGRAWPGRPTPWCSSAGIVVLADNTDLPGAAAAVRERYDGPVRAATVLGGGATAASTALAMCDLGARRIRLLARSAGPGRARRRPPWPRTRRRPTVEVDTLADGHGRRRGRRRHHPGRGAGRRLWSRGAPTCPWSSR